MAEIMQGGEMFKLIGTTVYTDRIENEEKCPTYIRVSSYSDMEPVIIAKAGDAFLRIGSMGYRDPNDRYKIDTHKTYIQVPANHVDTKTKRTNGEDALLEDISKVFADKFKQYIDATSGK